MNLAIKYVCFLKMGKTAWLSENLFFSLRFCCYRISQLDFELMYVCVFSTYLLFAIKLEISLSVHISMFAWPGSHFPSPYRLHFNVNVPDKLQNKAGPRRLTLQWLRRLTEASIWDGIVLNLKYPCINFIVLLCICFHFTEW